MNYQKHYNLLINNASSENRKKGNRSDTNYVYYERHHIIPKCISGTNHKTNLVLLTPKEHYVAHQLLVKIYPDVRGLILAAMKMAGKGNTERHFNGRLYGWIKNRLSSLGQSAEHILKNSLAHKGEKNNMFGKTHTEEVKTILSLSHLGEKNHMFGKHHKDTTKTKIGKIHKGKIESTETRKKKTLAHRDKNIYLFKHTITGELLLATRYTFFLQTKGNPKFMILGRMKTCRKWRLVK